MPTFCLTLAYLSKLLTDIVIYYLFKCILRDKEIMQTIWRKKRTNLVLTHLVLCGVKVLSTAIMLSLPIFFWPVENIVTTAGQNMDKQKQTWL